MKIWQRYIRKKMINVQEKVKVASAEDKNLRLNVLQQKRFDDLREFLREDFRKAQFGLRGGMRELRSLKQLYEDYHCVIYLEKLLQKIRFEVYLEECLRPRFIAHGYTITEDVLRDAMFSLLRADGVIISFPKTFDGVYACECKLAKNRRQREAPVR